MASNGEGTYTFTLGDKLMKKAQSELSEKDKWRARDIEAVREKVKAHKGNENVTSKGLHCPTDDAFILMFLRARKFDYDRAYDLICNYYTIRAKNKDIFDNLTPSSVKHVLDAGVSQVLPQPDQEGRRIIFFRPGKWIPGTFPIYDILKTNVLNISTILREDEAAQINGVCMLAEMSNVGLDHVKHFERKYGQLTAAVLQDAAPLRFKGMHAINEPSVIGVIFGIMKTFLKDKMIKRFHFHGSDLKALHKHFDPSILPEELGGTLGKGDDLAKQWKEHLLSKEQWFQDMLKYSIAVDRQISSTKSDEIVNCMVGTYKKLNID